MAARTVDIEPADVRELLASLGWEGADLDPALPPRVGYAGAWHLVIAAAHPQAAGRPRLRLRPVGRTDGRRDWTTIQLVWRETDDALPLAQPLPVGGVVEDPATGAAAAALGAYLRDLRLVPLPATITIRQGEDLGRPGRLTVDIPADRAQIEVTGAAVPIP